MITCSALLLEKLRPYLFMVSELFYGSTPLLVKCVSKPKDLDGRHTFDIGFVCPHSCGLTSNSQALLLAEHQR
ncbi:hypothetical protein VNO77_43873 [Canavalia gladiata]|uniref:Uncharacterized protein n=1 Tax=Canavalia gladiata TaxID=3824 RepID=A0AAN9PNA3_CANGL